MVLKQFPQRIVAFWKLVILLQHGAPLHLLWWLGRSAINEKWKRWWITNQFNITPLLPKWFRESLCLEITFLYSSRGVTFHSLLDTRCKITRYLLQKLLVAKNHSLLVAKNHSLLVAKFARYAMQKLLFAKNQLLLVAKFVLYPSQKLTRNSLRTLLVTRYRRWPLQKITRYSLQNSLVASWRSCSFQKITTYLLRNSLVTCYKN